jgi:SAM-dependent methyltransferase
MSEPRLDVAREEDRLSSPWWGMHEARYRFALQHIAGKTLLDVACGTGYGLPILLQAVDSAIGLDIDLASLRRARQELRNGRAAVVLGDACGLPFASGTFDTITSFETIEHLEDRSKFVQELVRVVAPGGACLISTPNANYTRPINGKPRNPHHVHEYTPEEFRQFLSRYFDLPEIVGQRLHPRFVISPFWDDQQNLHTFPELCRLAVWRVLWILVLSAAVAARGGTIDLATFVGWAHAIRYARSSAFREAAGS